MKLEFEVPDYAVEVVKTGVDMIVKTMSQGAAVNAEGSWLNKHPVTYHLKKGIDHVLCTWHHQDLLSREDKDPFMIHLWNGTVRFIFAETLRRMDKGEPQQGDE